MKQIRMQLNNSRDRKVLRKELNTTFAPTEYAVTFYNEDTRQILIRSVTEEEKGILTECGQLRFFPEERQHMKLCQYGLVNEQFYKDLNDLFKRNADAAHLAERTNAAEKLKAKIEAGTATPAEQLLWRVYESNLTKE